MKIEILSTLISQIFDYPTDIPDNLPLEWDVYCVPKICNNVNYLKIHVSPHRRKVKDKLGKCILIALATVY